MTVKQYSAEFQRLSRYTSNLKPDEESKAKRFRDGLTTRIREMIIHVRVIDYSEMVHMTTMTEKGIKAVQVCHHGER